MTKLTSEQVDYIRSYPLSTTMCRELAEELDITVVQVKNVLLGRTYGNEPINIPPQIASVKLSKEQIDYVVEQLRNPEWGTQTRLAKELGVSRALISQINRGHRKYAAPPA